MSVLGMASLGTQCADKALGMSSLGVFCDGTAPVVRPRRPVGGVSGGWGRSIPVADPRIRDDDDVILAFIAAFLEVNE